MRQEREGGDTGNTAELLGSDHGETVSRHLHVVPSEGWGGQGAPSGPGALSGCARTPASPAHTSAPIVLPCSSLRSPPGRAFSSLPDSKSRHVFPTRSICVTRGRGCSDSAPNLSLRFRGQLLRLPAALPAGFSGCSLRWRSHREPQCREPKPLGAALQQRRGSRWTVPPPPRRPRPSSGITPKHALQFSRGLSGADQGSNCSSGPPSLSRPTFPTFNSLLGSSPSEAAGT